MDSRKWLILILLFCALLAKTAAAQAGFNFNFGGGPGFPISQSKDFAGTSYHFVAGAGPNIGHHVKLNGEFMFHGLPIKQSVIDQLKVPIVKGRLYSVSGNIIVGGGNAKIGGYVIAGGGWYRRTLEAQRTVYQAGEHCEPVLVWWNIECTNGVFPTDVTIGSNISSAGGFNVGGGITYAIGDSSANFYTEVRYHRAFTAGIDTTVLPVTFGIRW